MQTLTLTDEQVIEAARKGFFEPAARMKQHPMSDSQMQTIFSLFMVSEEQRKNVYATWDRDESYFPQVVRSVAARFTRPTDREVLIFLCSICKSPGDLVMYLTYAHAIVARHRQERLSLDTLTNIYAMGFWSEEDRLTLWQGQKAPVEWGRYDNLLDTEVVLSELNAGEL
jgi:hypothetical protein